MLYVLFIVAFFLPTFQSTLANSGAILVNVAIFVTASTFIAFKKGELSLAVSKGQGIVVLGFALFAISIPISMVVGMLFSGVDISARDFFELHRPIFYCAIFLAGIFSARIYSFDTSIMRVLNFTFLLSLLIGLLQIFWRDLTIFGLYTKVANISKLRMSAPFLNPYDFAFFLSFYCCLYASVLGLVRRWRWYALFMLIIASVSMLFTQSRSVFVGMLFSVVVIIPFFATVLGSKRNFVFKNFVFRFGLISFGAITCAVITFIFFSENFPYLINSIMSFISNGSVGRSADLRITQFEFSVAKAVGSPIVFLFGNGPAKNEMPIVESLYTYLFYRYGFGGLISYLFIFIILPSWASLLGSRQNNSTHAEKSLFLAFAAWSASMAIMFLGNNFTEQTRLYFFYFFMAGYVMELSNLRRDAKGTVAQIL